MLTKDDLEQIRGVVRAEINPIHSEIVQVRDDLRTEIVQVRESLVVEIGELIEQNILPQFEELRKELRFLRASMITKFDLEDRLADFRLSLKGAV